jgi:hypothetical protein
MKVGDIVVWQIDNSTYSAKPGATAVVTGVTDDFLFVKWLENSNNQNDGGYFEHQFKKQ